MATLFLLSSFIKSFTTSQNECQTLNDIFHKAKQLWQQHQYKEAYRLFYGLGEIHHIEQSLCAWYQIQCLLQLQQWRHAIQACHLQIKRQPQVEEWYLLASDIYMQQHDYTLSWEILYRAPMLSSEITFRKRVAYEAAQQWRASMVNRSDILIKIPYDVATLIFYFIDLESLVRCTRVSKRWRQFLVNNPQLWNELEFEKRTAHLTPSTIDTYLKRLGKSSLTKLVIRNQQTDGDRIFLTLAERQCLKLKTLIISGVICTPTLFFNALECIGSALNTLHWGGVSIRLNELVDILANACPNLIHLKLHDCFTSLYDLRAQNGNRYRLETFGESLPNDYLQIVQTLTKLEKLKSLELSGIHGLNTGHLANLLFRCPHLKSLTLQRSLVDIVPVINLLRSCCSELQHLFYDRNQYCRHYDLSHQQRYPYHTPTLKTANRPYPWIQLKIHLTHMLTDTVLSYLLEGSSDTLELLDLQGNTMITDKGLIRAGKPLRQLKTLRLRECTGITAYGLIQLLSKNSQLEEIDLSGLTIINDDVFVQLTQCSSLKTLNLSKTHLSVTDKVYKTFINCRKDMLRKITFEDSNISSELLCYSMRKIKTSII